MDSEAKEHGTTGPPPPPSSVQAYINTALPGLIGEGKRYKDAAVLATVLADTANAFDETVEALTQPGKNGLTLKRVKLIAAILGLDQGKYTELLNLAYQETGGKIFSGNTEGAISYEKALAYVNGTLERLGKGAPDASALDPALQVYVTASKRFDSIETFIAVLNEVALHYREDPEKLLRLEQGLNRRQAGIIAAVLGFTAAESNAFIQDMQQRFGKHLPFAEDRSKPGFFYNEALRLADRTLEAMSHAAPIPLKPDKQKTEPVLRPTIVRVTNEPVATILPEELPAPPPPGKARKITPSSPPSPPAASPTASDKHERIEEDTTDLETSAPFTSEIPRIHEIKTVKEFVEAALATRIADGRFKDRAMFMTILGHAALHFGQVIDAFKQPGEMLLDNNEMKILAAVLGLYGQEFRTLQALVAKEHAQYKAVHDDDAPYQRKSKDERGSAVNVDYGDALDYAEGYDVKKKGETEKTHIEGAIDRYKQGKLPLLIEPVISAREERLKNLETKRATRAESVKKKKAKRPMPPLHDQSDETAAPGASPPPPVSSATTEPTVPSMEPIKDYIDAKLIPLIGPGLRYEALEHFSAVLDRTVEKFEESPEILIHPDQQGLTFRQVVVWAGIMGISEAAFREFLDLVQQQGKLRSLGQQAPLRVADAIREVDAIRLQLADPALWPDPLPPEPVKLPPAVPATKDIVADGPSATPPATPTDITVDVPPTAPLATEPETKKAAPPDTAQADTVRKAKPRPPRRREASTSSQPAAIRKKPDATNDPRLYLADKLTAATGTGGRYENEAMLEATLGLVAGQFHVPIDTLLDPGIQGKPTLQQIGLAAAIAGLTAEEYAVLCDLAGNKYGGFAESDVPSLRYDELVRDVNANIALAAQVQAEQERRKAVAAAPPTAPPVPPAAPPEPPAAPPAPPAQDHDAAAADPARPPRRPRAPTPKEPRPAAPREPVRLRLPKDADGQELKGTALLRYAREKELTPKALLQEIQALSGANTTQMGSLLNIHRKVYAYIFEVENAQLEPQSLDHIAVALGAQAGNKSEMTEWRKYLLGIGKTVDQNLLNNCFKTEATALHDVNITAQNFARRIAMARFFTLLGQVHGLNGYSQVAEAIVQHHIAQQKNEADAPSLDAATIAKQIKQQIASVSAPAATAVRDIATITPEELNAPNRLSKALNPATAAMVAQYAYPGDAELQKRCLDFLSPPKAMSFPKPEKPKREPKPAGDAAPKPPRPKREREFSDAAPKPPKAPPAPREPKKSFAFPKDASGQALKGKALLDFALAQQKPDKPFTFGDLLKFVCSAGGNDRGLMAKQFDIQVAQYDKFEEGRSTQPTLEALNKFADGLGASNDEERTEWRKFMLGIKPEKNQALLNSCLKHGAKTLNDVDVDAQLFGRTVALSRFFHLLTERHGLPSVGQLAQAIGRYKDDLSPQELNGDEITRLATAMRNLGGAAENAKVDTTDPVNRKKLAEHDLRAKVMSEKTFAEKVAHYAFPGKALAPQRARCLEFLSSDKYYVPEELASKHKSDAIKGIHQKKEESWRDRVKDKDEPKKGRGRG